MFRVWLSRSRAEARGGWQHRLLVAKMEPSIPGESSGLLLLSLISSHAKPTFLLWSRTNLAIQGLRE